MKNHIKFIITLTILCVMASGLAYSQYAGKARIKGLVTAEDGAPLENVKVKLFSQNAGSGFDTKTGKDGKWEAMWVRGGNWDLDFEKIGYDVKKITIAVQELGKETEVSVKLKKMEGLLLTKDLLDELEKGNTLFNAKKIDEAEAVYQKLLKDNPDAYIINLSIGNCYFERQNYDKAIEFYSKVFKDEPKSSKAMIAIGNCYNQKKDLNKAIEWYNKIEMEKLDNIDVLYNIGIFYFNKGQSDKALPYLLKAIQVKPDFLDGIYQLGMVYLGLNKMDEALALYDRYLTLDATSAQAKIVKDIVNSLRPKGKK
jgi:tetratricopeptide (TPR) repeat protein